MRGAGTARGGADIPAAMSRKVIDATGLYVTPGLIDLHAHVYGYGGSLFPDDTALIAGATTVVDARGGGGGAPHPLRPTPPARPRTRGRRCVPKLGPRQQ